MNLCDLNRGNYICEITENYKTNKNKTITKNWDV